MSNPIDLLNNAIYVNNYGIMDFEYRCLLDLSKENAAMLSAFLSSDVQYIYDDVTNELVGWYITSIPHEGGLILSEEERETI